MFNPFNNYKKIREENKQLEKLYYEQKEAFLREKKRNNTDPTRIVEKCFKRGIEWYDYNECGKEKQKQYYDEAQMILNSGVFNNEINFLIATGAESALLESMEPSQLRDFQMTINGLELLRNRLESISDPTEQKTKNDIYKSI
jgi:hypothetical protein